MTLFHWDLPYGLYRIGGWQNPAITDYFAEYARIVAEYLGDKVKHYITFNEPQCFIGLGHVTGEHAPGNIMSRRAVLEMAHHVLLAHGKATKVLRKVAPHAKIGYAPTCSAHYPDTQKPEDVEAARMATFDICPDPIILCGIFLVERSCSLREIPRGRGSPVPGYHAGDRGKGHGSDL